MTAAQRADLDHSLVAGIAWTAVLRWVAQIVSWLATFVAARLLAPSDYGIASMAMIAIGLVRMVEDFGLDAILVQDRSIVGVQQARLAGFMLAVGVGLYLVFGATAPLLADFFHESDVTPAILALGLLCITDALQVIPRAGLQRELKFSRLAWIHLIQVVVTQAVLLALALSGAGYWAVVLNTVAGAAVVTVVLIAWYPYAIRWPSGFATYARPLLQGWRVLMSRIAWYGYNRADQLIIGRVLGKDALGAYSFASTFATVPIDEIASVVTRVVPGVFSEVQERRDELRRYFLVLTEMLSYLTLPAAVGMALTADLFVRVALGPQWEAVIDPLRILCVYVAFQCSQTLISHLLLWTGQFRATMWCSALTLIALPLSMLFAVDYGLPGIAWTWAVVYPLTNIPPLVLGFRTIGISTAGWLDALKPAAAASAAMAAAVLIARTLTPDAWSLPLRFAAAVGIGVLVYPAALWVLFRQRCLDVWTLVRRISRHASERRVIAGAT